MPRTRRTQRALVVHDHIQPRPIAVTTLSEFSRRRNPLQRALPDELESAVAEIATEFDQNWLSDKTGSHRLQRLWQRRDALAAIELSTFGSSLRTGRECDPKWLDHQVRVIKRPDINNQNGAIFEILAANQLGGANQVVIPAAIDQRGYDLDVDGPSALWRISLKTYAESVHSRYFRKRMDVIREFAIRLLSEHQQHAQILIVGDGFPMESDWQELKTLVFRQFHPIANTNAEAASGIWTILLRPLPQDSSERFATARSSYTFTATIPFHPNEQNNFVDKLDSAVAQLAKHLTPSRERNAIVLLRVPLTASTTALQAWADGYFTNHKQGALDGVFMVQPYLKGTEDGGESLAYYLAASVSDRCREAGDVLTMTFPVGAIASNPPTWRFKDDSSAARPLGSRYVFQRGEHFVLFNSTATGSKVTMRRKAPGVRSYAMLEDRKDAATVGGSWGDELLLLV